MKLVIFTYFFKECGAGLQRVVDKPVGRPAPLNNSFIQQILNHCVFGIGNRSERPLLASWCLAKSK